METSNVTAPADLVAPSFDLPPYGHLIRVFTIEGEVWEVYEDRREGPPTYGPTIVFVSDRVARRVHHHAEDWSELSDEQLYALSWLP